MGGDCCHNQVPLWGAPSPPVVSVREALPKLGKAAKSSKSSKSSKMGPKSRELYYYHRLPPSLVAEEQSPLSSLSPQHVRSRPEDCVNPLTNKKCFDKIKILIVLGRSTLIHFILTQIFNCFALQFMLRVKI